MLVKKNFATAVHIVFLVILTWGSLILPRTSFASPVLPTLNPEFEALKAQINSKKSNRQKYQALHRYLNKHHIPAENIDEIEAAIKEGDSDSSYALQMKILNGIAVISTWGQYNRLGFILMIDANNKVILNNRHDKGIVDVKEVHNIQASPQYLFIAEISTITGTGTYGKMLDFYAIDGGQVYNTFSKPSYEHNSGWGVFEADTVIFLQHNDYQAKNGVYEIHTTGKVTLENRNGNTVQRLLPDEHYVWNPVQKKFLQTEGRITANEVYLTSLYGDFADPKGDWFKKIKTVNGQELRSILSSPEAFVEEKFDHPHVPN